MAVNIEQVLGECRLSQFENFCTLHSIELRFKGIKKAGNVSVPACFIGLRFYFIKSKSILLSDFIGTSFPLSSVREYPLYIVSTCIPSISPYTLTKGNESAK